MVCTCTNSWRVASIRRHGAFTCPFTQGRHAVGHHGNLLVYEPGNYRFVDFVRVGTPLTVMLGIAVACIAPLLWPA